MKPGHKLLSIVFVLFFSTTLYAQQTKDIPFVWNNFSKGLDTKTSPHVLTKEKSVISENIRYNEEAGSITKRDEVLSYGVADTTEVITGMHRLYLKDGTKKLIVTHGNEIEVGDDDAGTFSTILDLTTGDYKWQWVTWHNIAIGGDGYNQPVKTDGTDATYLGSCFAEDAGDGAGPDGTYTYKIGYYTTSYEVIFDQVSNPVTVVNNDIDLSMIPIAPTTYGGEDVVGRKVYRNTVAAQTTWELLSNGTIANNTATTLTDSDTDDTLSGAYNGDATYTPPKGKFPVIHRNRLWFANDPANNPSRIYYGEDGNHDTFIHGSSYFNIRPNDGDDITFAKNLLGLLTIAKNNTIQKIYTQGATPSSDWEISDPYSFVGCQAPYSAQNTPLGVIYLASSGLYKFNGQHSILISDIVSPEIKDISESDFANCWGQHHKNLYYLAYTSEVTGAIENDKVLIFDLIGNSYTHDIFKANAFCTFNSGTDWDVLYSGSSTDGTVYAHSETVHVMIHKKHSDFPGNENQPDTWDNMRYIPTSVGGDAEDPVLELAWDMSIDEMSGTIDAPAEGTDAGIDRAHKTGTYISQTLQMGANTFDKLYWNETFQSAGCDVQLYVRAGATQAACHAASWSDAFSTASGSEISDVTAGEYVQYKIAFTTDDRAYTPTMYKANNFVVKMTYNTEGTTAETTIPLHWRGGWEDFNAPGYTKGLTRLYAYYDWPENTEGTLTLTFENFEGDTDTFEIDLEEYPNSYTEVFTGSKFTGKKIRLDIQEDSLNDLVIREIGIIYDIEEYYD